MKLQATSTRIIFTRIEPEKTTASGLILKSTEEIPQARVVSIGPKVDAGVVLGQRILVDWSRVAQVKFEEQDYYITDQTNVLAVFD